MFDIFLCPFWTGCIFFSGSIMGLDTNFTKRHQGRYIPSTNQKRYTLCQFVMGCNLTLNLFLQRCHPTMNPEDDSNARNCCHLTYGDIQTKHPKPAVTITISFKNSKRYPFLPFCNCPWKPLEVIFPQQSDNNPKSIPSMQFFALCNKNSESTLANVGLHR